MKPINLPEWRLQAAYLLNYKNSLDLQWGTGGRHKGQRARQYLSWSGSSVGEPLWDTAVLDIIYEQQICAETIGNCLFSSLSRQLFSIHSNICLNKQKKDQKNPIYIVSIALASLSNATLSSEGKQIVRYFIPISQERTDRRGGRGGGQTKATGNCPRGVSQLNQLWENTPSLGCLSDVFSAFGGWLTAPLQWIGLSERDLWGSQKSHIKTNWWVDVKHAL